MVRPTESWREREAGTAARVALLIAAFVVLPVAAGCGGGGRTAAWEDTTADTAPVTAESQSQKEQLVEQGNAAWEQRDDEAQLRAAIAAWQQALELDASDWELWHRLARAQYFLADGHMAFDPALEAETTQMYQNAVTSAEQSLLHLSPEFAQRMNAGERVDQALSVLTAQAAPALYWRSAGLGKWARRDGFATLLSHKDEIRAIMTRVLELDRDYFYAGPDRYFGAFFAVAPTYAGGDLPTSRQHFEYSISRSPNYFGTHVLFAVEYAVKAQDRALFERELNFVINGDPNALPDVRPENLAEQRKATEAMARIDELFE
ncbi:MAG: TRAP transporter TatT component family protein [Myxococcota bacterium]|nr:TRAP transporter TatT component family protein [Myxococcota bacterium]